MSKREHNITDNDRRLQYLQSNGNTYIDTGYKLTSNNFRIECGYYIDTTPSPSNQYYSLFGSMGANYHNNGYGCCLAQRDRYNHTSDNVNLACGSIDANKLNITLDQWNNVVLTQNANRYITLDIDGNTYSVTSSKTSVNNYNILLFWHYHLTKSTASTYGVRLSYYKLYQNSTLVLDLVAYLKSGIPGMLNMSDNVFMPNNGTDNFLYN